MKVVAGPQGLAGVKGKPALPTLLLRTAVPGDPERLIAAARKGDQILLERRDAEGVGDFVIVWRAVWPLCPHHELFAIAGKSRCNAVMGQRYAVEIAEDRGGARLLHGEFVVRCLPAFGLSRMATAASRCSDECGRRLCWRFRFRRVDGQQACEHQDYGADGRKPDKDHVAQFLRHRRP